MPKKETANAADDRANSQSGRERLRQIVERIESLEEDKRAVAEEIKQAFSNAKGEGYDTKILRRLLAERKRDAAEVLEEESVLELYRMALGMSSSLDAMADEADDEDDADDLV